MRIYKDIIVDRKERKIFFKDDTKCADFFLEDINDTLFINYTNIPSHKMKIHGSISRDNKLNQLTFAIEVDLLANLF